MNSPEQQGKARLRIAIVADGPVDSAGTNSGVAMGVSRAIAADPRVEYVVGIDSVLGTIGKSVARAVTFHPKRSEWNRRYFQSLVRQRLRSWKRDWKLGTMRRPVDAVLHVRNVYYPTRRPYYAFVDTSYRIRQEMWPSGGFAPEHLADRLALESEYFRSAQRVLTAGEYVAEHIAEAAPSFARPVAVGAGLNLDINRTASPANSLRILFVGKEFERKGGGTLLAAFARVHQRFPDAELHIVGPQRGAPQEGVVWHGLITDRGALSDLYASAALFCLPAVFEPFGLVVLEAMAHGLPTVVTDVGVLGDLVADGASGFVTRPADVNALADALERLLADASLRAEMGESARRSSLEFTWERVGQRIVDVIAADLGYLRTSLGQLSGRAG